MAEQADLSADEAERERRRRHHDAEHDWQSRDYVDSWIAKDRTREERRRPLFDQMIAAIPFPKTASIRVLDVGGGYGAVSDAVLAAFPNASVTLQDYSQAMLGQARGHLSAYGARVSFALGDLCDRDWVAQVQPPFDVAVSAIAIHNLMTMAAIAPVYADIRKLLKSGGVFIDYDHFDHVESIDAHDAAMRRGGFVTVERLWYKVPTGIIRATA